MKHATRGRALLSLWYIILFDYGKKWKNVYEMLSLKSEVSLESFIIWG